MAQQSITNLRALKAYKRFGEFCKLMLAGFSAILFFSYEKIDCLPLKLIEGFVSIIGVALCGISLMGFIKAGDRIEEAMDTKDATNSELKDYKEANAVIDPLTKLSRVFYGISIMLLLISALGFILNPIICPSAEKEEIKSNNNIIYITPCDTCKNDVAPPPAHCKSKCGKVKHSGRCSK